MLLLFILLSVLVLTFTNGGYENIKNIIVEDNVKSNCLSSKISLAVIPNIEVILYYNKYKNFIIIN